MFLKALVIDPMFPRQLFLGFFGICAGSIIAAGVFAFLSMIGVFPRLMGWSRTPGQAKIYETATVLGGILGNLLNLYNLPIPLGSHLSDQIFLGIAGLSIGTFVGCLVMSLAETVKALPVMNRRIRLAVGFQYIILAIALGKLGGSLLYFFRDMSVP